MSRWIAILIALSIAAVIVFVLAVKSDVVILLRERAARRERERVRKEAFLRSKELLQFMLADPDVARLVRNALVRELGPPAEDEIEAVESKRLAS